jgi:sulfotransferase family protein
MTRAASPLRDRMIFIVGARRSGTNWLQRMVCAHPATVAIPSETFLFTEGIKPLAARFQHGAAGSTTTGHTWMERDAMLDGLRDFCDAVFVGLRDALRPGAERVVERTPDHVRCLDLIGAVYPDAHVVHIIRDGRDVTRSLLSQEWGPATVAEAAEEWRSAIEAARAAVPALRHYREVGYEDLLADPRPRLSELLEWLGLPASDEVLESALVEARVKYNVDPAAPRTRAGKWRTAFSPEEVEVILRVAGPTLAELGYADATAAPHDTPHRTPPVAATPRTKGFARLSRKLRAVRWRRRNARRRALPRQAEAQAVVDRFLQALAERRFADAAEMVRERGSVRIVSPGHDWKGRGTAARTQLQKALESDPAMSARQVRADLHPSVPMFTFVASYQLADGTAADRLLLLSVQGERIGSVTFYHAAIGD